MRYDEKGFRYMDSISDVTAVRKIDAEMRTKMKNYFLDVFGSFLEPKGFIRKSRGLYKVDYEGHVCTAVSFTPICGHREYRINIFSTAFIFPPDEDFFNSWTFGIDGIIWRVRRERGDPQYAELFKSEYLHETGVNPGVDGEIVPLTSWNDMHNRPFDQRIQDLLEVFKILFYPRLAKIKDMRGCVEYAIWENDVHVHLPTMPRAQVLGGFEVEGIESCVSTYLYYNEPQEAIKIIDGHLEYREEFIDAVKKANPYSSFEGPDLAKEREQLMQLKSTIISGNYEHIIAEVKKNIEISERAYKKLFKGKFL